MTSAASNDTVGQVIENVNVIPKDKHVGVRGAINAGVVALKCVVNRFCPFMRSPRVEDVIVFNHRTIASWPRRLREQIGTEVGYEGIFLKPRCVPRHMFLFADSVDRVEDEDGNEIDVPSIDNLPSKLSHTPIYKLDQQWAISDTPFYTQPIIPFDYNSVFADLDGRCSEKAIWDYKLENMPGVDSGRQDNDEAIIEDDNVQMPMQTRAQTCDGVGVHWRLEKRTPLFRGEDFWVEFRKLALSTDIHNKVKRQKGFSNSYYRRFYGAIDVYDNSSPVLFADLNRLVHRNQGIVTYNRNVPDKEEGFLEGVQATYTPVESSRAAFDFNDQAYYIIEIGLEHAHDHHYFIILTQRNFPTLIQMKDGVSIALGTYGEIPSRQLIEADRFRMMVRNHLGRFAIQFEVNGSRQRPWLVQRVDKKIRANQESDEAKIMITEGHIALWGGNMLSGVLFGPLEYESRAELDVPPRESGVKFKLPTSNSPVKAKQRAVFSASDENLVFRTETSNNPSLQGGAVTGRNFYTQDAQRIRDDDFPSGRRITFFDQRFTATQTPQSYKEESDAGLSRLEVRKKRFEIDPSDRTDSFAAEYKLFAGSHRFSSGWILRHCKTPVLTSTRFVADRNDKPLWNADAVDVSDHVMHFNDSWSTQDWRRVEHTGVITFLLNPDMFIAENKRDFIASLKDKAFYVTIWGGYVKKRGLFEGFSDSNPCNYSKIPGLFRLFTGICYGGEFTVEYGKLALTCQIFDYSKILEDQIFLNSPFFDGMRDFNAINEILELAGFRNKSRESPGFLVKEMAQSDDENITVIGLDGRTTQSHQYALPAAYNRLLEPNFKFKEGEKYWDAISKIANLSGKRYFFDAFGVFHYELNPDSHLFFGAQTGRADAFDELESAVLWVFSTNPGRTGGQQVFNTLNVQHSVIDVHNFIKIVSNTPDFTPVIADSVNYDSIENPKSTGFLGYKKMYFQTLGILGSGESAVELAQQYGAINRRPPIIAKFETYGQPVRALDIIRIDGQLMRVQSVSSELDPAKNVWWQRFECEWLHPNVSLERRR